MQAKGYTCGRHFLPHDANQTGRHHSTFFADVQATGLKNITVVPPIPDVWTGINYVAELMPSFEFRTPACDTGVKGLKACECAADSSSGVVRNVPCTPGPATSPMRSAPWPKPTA
jgi:hypothetical protein